MELSVLVLTIFFSPLLVFGYKNPGEFKKEYYRGPQYNAVVAVVHKSSDFKTPKCYGTLLNWRVALVPCSCMVRPLNADQEAIWYDHYRKFKVRPDDPSSFKVLVMPFQYHPSQIIEKVKATVTKIKLDPKCNSGFQYNMARIELSKSLPRSKMAWVSNPFQDRMKTIITNFAIGQPVEGLCFVNQWFVLKNETPTDQFTPRIEEIPVNFAPWSSCGNVVCPTNVEPPQGKKIRRDKNVCDNKVSTSRHCVEWDRYGSLCALTPGTPVFCNAGRLVGLAGFIHNSGMWCNEYVTTKQAVMEGVDLALPLIRYDLRAINIYQNKTGLHR